MPGYYYVWCGIGAVVEDEMEEIHEDSVAIRFLHNWSRNHHGDRTWTLWHILEGHARMVAYCVPGQYPVLIGDNGVPIREIPTGSDPAYSVHLGTIHRALRTILNQYGLNRPRIDALVAERIDAVINARLDHWLHNPTTSNFVLDQLARFATGQHPTQIHPPAAPRPSAFEQMLQRTITDEVFRVVSNGLKINFTYPSQPADEPHRRIRRPEGGNPHEELPLP